MTRNLTVLLVALAAPVAALGQNQKDVDRLQRFDNQFRPQRGGGFNARPAIHEPFTPPVTAAKIRTAIDDAVLYLRSMQSPEGNIGDEGVTTLATLTMLAA